MYFLLLFCLKFTNIVVQIILVCYLVFVIKENFKMTKVYSFEESQPVIKEAWSKAVQHLQETLGDQYSYNVTRYAWEKFQDYIEQDIEFKMTCPCCGVVDIEGNFSFSKFEPNEMICYDCYSEELTK